MRSRSTASPWPMATASSTNASTPCNKIERTRMPREPVQSLVLPTRLRHVTLVRHPHSLKPHTWHFTQPSAYSSWLEQSGHVPMKLSPLS